VTEKYLTVLVVPHDERTVRRLRVSYRWLKVWTGLGAALLILLVLAIASYGRLASRAARATLLERENAQLEAENEKVDEIAENLRRTEQAYAQIRDMAGLPPAVSPAGVAGEPSGPGPAASGSEANGAVPLQAASGAPDSLPSGWPLALKGFQTAAYTGADGHPGIDVAVPVHTPVLATARGTVAAADSDPVYGHYVILAHGGGVETMYGHNAVLLVEVGETVERGQPIAYSGNSGRSTAPHLHYEIRRAGRAIDPAPYLR
jgi:murein DD-endopeptidase MepM/ murein hydrolase activator NlpD